MYILYTLKTLILYNFVFIKIIVTFLFPGKTIAIGKVLKIIE